MRSGMPRRAIGKLPELDAVLARKIAEKAHRGQTERDGAPYIHHLDRVAASAPEDLKIPAFLHDIVEDTDFTIVDLRNLGVSIADCFVIHRVTRRLDQYDYLDDFIAEIIDSNDARAILLKALDVKDHLRPGYERVLGENQITKYTLAYMILCDALGPGDRRWVE